MITKEQNLKMLFPFQNDRSTRRMAFESKSTAEKVSDIFNLFLKTLNSEDDSLRLDYH